jgi:hypothetical protein
MAGDDIDNGIKLREKTMSKQPSDSTDRYSVTWEYGSAKQQHIRDANRASDRPDDLSLDVDDGTITATGTPETIRWLYDHLHYLKRAWRQEGAQWDADVAEEMARELYEQVDDDLPERQRAKVAIPDGGADVSGAYRGECPKCEVKKTFSEQKRFGTLSCDSCGYTPQKKLRDKIRSRDTDTDHDKGDEP